MVEPTRQSEPVGWLGSIFAWTLFFGWLAVFPGCNSQQAVEEPVRIVLISLDTLRYDSLFSAGEQSVMPQLREWSKKATVFDRFYSATASTQPSHASMFTGLHPWEHGLTSNGEALSESVSTIVEDFQEAGFWTAAVVASFPLSSQFGFDRGFNHYQDSFELGTIRGEWGEDSATAEAKTLSPFYSLGYSVQRKTQKLIQSAPPGKQFFWIHLFDPHNPYGDHLDPEQTMSPHDAMLAAHAGEDPAPLIQRARSLYEADIRVMDEILVALLSEFEKEPRTHIVIVADHGESFGEHGSVAHGRRLINSQIRVPCVISSSRIAPGRRTAPAGSVDIAPTLLGFANIDVRPERELSGRDLALPADRRTRALGMRRTYSRPRSDRRLDGSIVVLDGLLFFAVGPNGVLRRGNGEGLSTLEGEQASNPGEAESLRRLFSGFEEQVARNKKRTTMDLETRAKLKALGYTP